MFVLSQKEKGEGGLLWLKANSLRLSWLYKFCNADDEMWKTLFKFGLKDLAGCRYVYSVIFILNT